MTTQILEAEIPAFENNNGAMPKLGLGTFQTSGEVCRNAVRTALETGYRHIDTARMYENEVDVGKGIRDSGVAREELFVTTKLQMGQLSRQGVQASCDQSLADLNMDYIDLLLIHWPEKDMSLPETLEAMAGLKQKGKIRHMGISNFTTDWIRRALEASDQPLFCNQVEYHPYIDQAPVLRLCNEHHLGVVAYSPLARGRSVKDDRLVQIGRKYNKSPAQIALRWLVQQPGVIAIPKGSSTEHIRENAEIFDFILEPSDHIAISTFPENNRLINPDWAPDWDT